MDIPSIYGRNIAGNMVIIIKNRQKFNRLVRREFSRLNGRTEKSPYLSSRDIAGMAIGHVLQDNPDLWAISTVLDMKTSPGVLRGWLGDSGRENIAEVLTCIIWLYLLQLQLKT